MKEAYENPMVEIVEIDGGVDIICTSGGGHVEAE